jgi:hypothetical protein
MGANDGPGAGSSSGIANEAEVDIVEAMLKKHREQCHLTGDPAVSRDAICPRQFVLISRVRAVACCGLIKKRDGIFD